MRPKWVQPEDIVNSMSSSYIFITVSVAAWRRRKTRAVRPCDLAFQKWRALASSRETKRDQFFGNALSRETKSCYPHYGAILSSSSSLSSLGPDRAPF